MSLVSGYTAAYNENNSGSPVASSPFYPADYSSPSSTGVTSHHHHHQTFFASTGNWSWSAANGQAASDYHHSNPTEVHHHQEHLHHHQQSVSPDYYGGYSHHHQQYPVPVEYHQHHHSSSIQTAPTNPPPVVRAVRVVKRRNTANKKERRRTMSINNAFSELRDCIPNVPADTKLSKIKTLRLATSYISYLMAVLEAGSDTDIPFRAELGRQSKSDKMAAAAAAAAAQQQQQNYDNSGCFHKDQIVNNKEEAMSGNATSAGSMVLCPASGGDKRSKGRTGWPHHVWALELKQ